MKLINILLIVIVAVSCEKVDKTLVTVTIKDKNTGDLLPDFSYKIMTHGLGGMQSETKKTGIIENGYISFNYTTVNNRVNELTVKSESLKGYFPNYGFSQNITEKNRSLVFEFVPLKNLKIVATNSGCLNDNDKIGVKIYQGTGASNNSHYVSANGCIQDKLIFDKPLTAGNYVVNWEVTRDTGIIEGSTDIKLTELEDYVLNINY